MTTDKSRDDALTPRHFSLLHKMQIGGCTCLTKTPELQYHAEDCEYRLALEIELALLRPVERTMAASRHVAAFEVARKLLAAPTAPAPADERAACIAWANANGFTKYHESMWAAWEERARRASSANETGAEGAEPCAWLVEWTPNVSDKVWVQSFVNELDAINKQRQVGGRIIACAPINALSHAPAHAAEPVAIPVGWKLVPVAPTPEMCCAMEEAIDAGWKDSVVWARGIAAAPQLPAQADAREGLTDEGSTPLLAAVEWCIENGNCGPRTRATLVAVRALLKGADHAE